MPDVFISYARATAPQARLIAGALAGLGHDVWSDDELPPHRAYAEVIEENLRASRAVVVVWSADAVKSQWVRAEADLARALGTLVQLSVDHAAPPLPFNQIQCADLSGWTGEGESAAWGRVVASVAELVGRDVRSRSELHLADAMPPAPAAPGRSGGLAWRRVGTRPLGLTALGIGAAVLAIVLAGGLGYARYAAERAVSRTTPEALRAALAPYIAAADCAWLSAEPRRGPNGVGLQLSGLAGDPAAVARQVDTLIKGAGLSASVDSSDLNRVDPAACGPLNTFLKFRENPAAASLALPRTQFGFEGHPAGCDPAAGRQAKTMAVITVPPPADFTLIGMEPTGRLQQVLASRSDFMADMKANPSLFIDENGQLMSYLCVDERTAKDTSVVIEVLVKGQGPFNLDPLDLKQTDAMTVDNDWLDRFWASARAKGWTTQIAWFRVR